MLETYGVPVVGFRTEEFPGFFTNLTGCKSPSVVGSSDEVAKMMLASRNLQLDNGMLVAVPNPAPAADQAAIARCISSALIEAHNKGIQGAAVTPFLLAEGMHHLLLVSSKKSDCSFFRSSHEVVWRGIIRS